MSPTEFVSLTRASAPELPDTTHLDQLEDEAFRYAVCEELNKCVLPSDRSLARYIMRLYVTSHGGGSWGMSDDIRLCAFVLYKIANVEDVPLLWEAKTANFDTFCGLDIQMLVGAGVDQTLDYLKTLGNEHAVAAADYIKRCRVTGDFNYLDRYAEEWDRYFSN
jgi:hypothetical protein